MTAEPEPGDGRNDATLLGDGPADPGSARLLFRYIGGEEWQDYRAIMSVLAGTFFAEFSPDDVAIGLNERGVEIDSATTGSRLESLRQWGNVSVSTSVGNPSSLADYYKRRRRYLITRHGQEVHDIVEGVLSRVDQMGDVQAGRLRDLHRAVQALLGLIEAGLDDATAAEMGDAVRAVFDPHRAFSTEITQFFAALNQWQNKYDLDTEQVQFFAEVLVGYVSEQLTEIERMTRPIATSLRQLAPHLPQVIAKLDTGLAGRVQDAGLGETIGVSRAAGGALIDWEHLDDWFSAPPGGRSRLDVLTRQALAAVGTLTKNITRISRSGAGSVSRRNDFIRLAGWFDAAENIDEAHDLAAGALGLFPARHLGALASDADDPVPSSVSWAEPGGPRAMVPVSLRERGEQSARGRPSPIRDRSEDRDRLRALRRIEAEGHARAAAEIVAAAAPDGLIADVWLSQPAFNRLRDLVAQAASRRVGTQFGRQTEDADISMIVERVTGRSTTIRCPEGTLFISDTAVTVRPTVPVDRAGTQPVRSGIES